MASQWLAGAGLGALVTGIVAAASRVGERPLPPWPDVAGATSYLPVLAAALDPLSGLFVGSALLLMVVALADRVTDHWTRRRAWAGAAIVVLGLALAGVQDVHSIAGWALAGVAAGLVLLGAHVVLLRFDLALVPLAVAAVLALRGVGSAVLGAYPGARVGGWVGAVLVLAAAELWRRALRRDSGALRADAP